MKNFFKFVKTFSLISLGAFIAMLIEYGVHIVTVGGIIISIVDNILARIAIKKI